MNSHKFQLATSHQQAHHQEVVAATKAVKPAVAVADSSAYQPVHFHVFAEEDPTFMLDCPNALCYISFAQVWSLVARFNPMVDGRNVKECPAANGILR